MSLISAGSISLDSTFKVVFWSKVYTWNKTFWHGTKHTCLKRNVLACRIPPIGATAIDTYFLRCQLFYFHIFM
jgi:hypothetical protein